MALSSKRKRALLVACFVLFVIVPVSVTLLRRPKAPPKQTAPAAPQPALVRELTLQGRIAASAVVNVGVPVDGQLAAFHAEIGDEVYEGQLLAEIRNEGNNVGREAAETDLESAQERVTELDSAIAASRLESSRASADASRARSEYERALKTFTRQKVLIAEGATPRQIFERSEREYKAAEAESSALGEVAKRAEERVRSLQGELDTARKRVEEKNLDLEAASARLEAGQVLSPVGGIVTGRRGVAGDEVHPVIQDLFQIATDLSKLTVLVNPPSTSAERVRPGMEALITVPDLPSETLTGSVTAVENGQATILFANPSPLVKPGGSAVVRIRLP